LQTLAANQESLPEIEIEIPINTETLPLTVMAVDDNPANVKMPSNKPKHAISISF